jgi:signal transduction histidine kinase
LSEGLKSVGAKADRLNRIVQAMLKLARGGALSDGLTVEEFDFADLLDEMQKAVAPLVKERGQTLEIDARGLTPIHADRDKLFDIVENLTTNAIKFTPEGGTVRIAARWEGDRFVFSVSDRGTGIPPEEQAHLFEPFFSGGEVLQHSSGEGGYQKRGMGLGLALVKYFVELHRGSVAVATGPDGSTFTVTLPAGALPAGTLPAGTLPAGTLPAGTLPAGTLPAGTPPAAPPSSPMLPTE